MWAEHFRFLLHFVQRGDTLNETKVISVFYYYYYYFLLGRGLHFPRFRFHWGLSGPNIPLSILYIEYIYRIYIYIYISVVCVF